ncbi:conserved hypothetical protein [Lausannevirus]|uniref:Uncharacterized protein n=2 Tax=Lausannevirus TaxID=999883 RepID=A0A0N9PVE8_9VIRU|nr:hypothetical protein LAU_0118 [Lausannevirus]AEA06970.1 conserved hypothetical protein [Lausannevirus]ALH06802.1 hypothetical protein PMV_104 [Port-miou virus]
MSRLQGFFKDIPIVGSYSALPPVLPRGSLVFLTSDETLYVSDGTTWNATGGDIGPLAAQVAQNTADIGVLQTQVGTLQGEVATNTLDIGTLQTQVSTNTSDIGTLQTQVAGNSTNISALQTDVATLEGQVATNTTDIGTLQSQVATNTTNIQQNSDSITALLINQSQGFSILDNTQTRAYTQPISRVDVASVSPTVIYTLGIPLAININAVYLIQWNVLAHYETANVYFAVGQSSVLSNGVGSLVSVFGTTTNQTNNSGAANIAVTADFSTPNFRLIVTSDSAVNTTYSGYVIVTNILNIVP